MYSINYYDTVGLCDRSFGDEFKTRKIAKDYAEKHSKELEGQRGIFRNVSYKIMKEKIIH